MRRVSRVRASPGSVHSFRTLRSLGTTVGHGLLLHGMEPMTTFDPDVPCKVHDRLNDRTLDWRTRWAQD